MILIAIAVKASSQGRALYWSDRVGKDNIIYNLDQTGKIVDGWKYTKTTNRINQNPIHFIVEEKDYILQATNNSTTKLLARNGTARTIFKDPYSFSTPVNISENGTLYAITAENKLWTAYVNGDTEILELPTLNHNTKVLAYNKGYYLANKNVISYINTVTQEEIFMSAMYLTVYTIL